MSRLAAVYLKITKQFIHINRSKVLFQDCIESSTKTTSFTPNDENTGLTEIVVNIKVYKKRWVILILYIAFSISATIQTMQYVVVADVIKNYYQVSYLAVDWTVMLPPLLNILFTIPANYAIDKLGVRRTLIIGVIGISIGTWIKVASVHPDRFWVVLFGHGIVSLFQICCCMPLAPKIAATWFGYNQIATACGLCIAGFEAGTSLAYLLPPLVVFQSNIVNIERGLYTITIIYAVFTTLMIPLIIFFFSDKPELPPSFAQYNFITTRKTASGNFLGECKALITNKNYIIFMIINGISSSSVIALENLSNQIILTYYPDAALHVGIIGVLHVLFSLFGAIGCSVLLDKYKKFKLFSWIAYGFLFSSLILFAGTIKLGLFFVYVSLMLLGVLFGSILTLSVEVIVELTYPQSQNVAMGLSGICYNLCVIMSTSLYGYMHRNFDNNWANITIIAIVFVISFLFFILKFDLRRKLGETEVHNRVNYS